MPHKMTLSLTALTNWQFTVNSLSNRNVVVLVKSIYRHFVTYVRKTRREFENCTKTNVRHDHKYNENPKRLTIIFSTAITLELVLEVNHRL